MWLSEVTGTIRLVVTVDPEEVVPYFTGIILTIMIVMELENLVRRGLP